MLKKELLTTDLFGSQTSQIILKFLKIESDCQFFSQQCALCVICVLSVSPMSVCYLCHLCRLCLCAICLSYVCHLCIICVICVNCVQCVSSMSSVSPVSVSVYYMCHLCLCLCAICMPTLCQLCANFAKQIENKEVFVFGEQLCLFAEFCWALINNREQNINLD